MIANAHPSPHVGTDYGTGTSSTTVITASASAGFFSVRVYVERTLERSIYDRYSSDPFADADRRQWAEAVERASWRAKATSYRQPPCDLSLAKSPVGLDSVPRRAHARGRWMWRQPGLACRRERLPRRSRPGRRHNWRHEPQSRGHV